MWSKNGQCIERAARAHLQRQACAIVGRNEVAALQNMQQHHVFQFRPMIGLAVRRARSLCISIADITVAAQRYHVPDEARHEPSQNGKNNRCDLNRNSRQEMRKKKQRRVSDAMQQLHLRHTKRCNDKDGGLPQMFLAM